MFSFRIKLVPYEIEVFFFKDTNIQISYQTPNRNGLPSSVCLLGSFPSARDTSKSLPPRESPVPSPCFRLLFWTVTGELTREPPTHSLPAHAPASPAASSPGSELAFRRDIMVAAMAEESRSPIPSGLLEAERAAGGRESSRSQRKNAPLQGMLQ